MKINIIAADVVNEVTCSRESVNTRVLITLLLHDVIHGKTETSYDKYRYAFESTLHTFFPNSKGKLNKTLNVTYIANLNIWS